MAMPNALSERVRERKRERERAEESAKQTWRCLAWQLEKLSYYDISHSFAARSTNSFRHAHSDHDHDDSDTDRDRALPPPSLPH